jgi:hypothetical protein
VVSAFAVILYANDFSMSENKDNDFLKIDSEISVKQKANKEATKQLHHKAVDEHKERIKVSHFALPLYRDSRAFSCRLSCWNSIKSSVY